MLDELEALNVRIESVLKLYVESRQWPVKDLSSAALRLVRFVHINFLTAQIWPQQLHIAPTLRLRSLRMI